MTRISTDFFLSVSLRVIRGKRKNTNMPEIPEKLKWYLPFGLGNYFFATQPNWRVCVDEITGCVEIRRAPLLEPIAVMAIVLGTILVGGIYVVDFGEKENVRGLIMFYVVLFPIGVIMLSALNAFLILRNSKYWKKPLRFRYDPKSSELFFPRENVLYQKQDYVKLVLGCVRGSDLRKCPPKKFGMYWMVSGSCKPTTQVFVLVLDKNNEWIRYNLSDDCYHRFDWQSTRELGTTRELGSRQFIRVVATLQPLFAFEQIVKDYSMDECYEQQNMG
jgi:hypothetical protein